jgi:alpha-L-rhamnosidase
VPSGGGPGGWGCAIVHVPWVYYQTYGDSTALRSYYPNMRRYLDYLEFHSENDLVTSDEPGNLCLGEWCVPGLDDYFKNLRIPVPFVNNYFYIKTLRELKEIAVLIGKPEDVAEYEATEQRKIAALLRDYYDVDTGDFFGNDQGANAFMVDLGLGDARTLRTMIAHYKALGSYDTGIFGTDVVTRVLFDHGEDALAFALLSNTKEVGYAQMKAKGATTLWENWAGTDSQCHPMFGAAVEYLFRDLLGVRQRPGTAGFTDLIISPAKCPGFARRGHITNAFGKIEVTVDSQGKVRVALPRHTKAELRDR